MMSMCKNVNISSQMMGKARVCQNTPILSYGGSYPVLSAENPSFRVEGPNRYYKESFQGWMQKTGGTLWPMAVSDFEDRLAQDAPFPGYEGLRSFTTTLNEGCLLSLYTDTYEFTGGAHGTTIRKAESWQFPQGKRLSLSDLFPGCSNYQGRIIAAIAGEIGAQVAAGSMDYFENSAQLAGETFDPCQFYLSPEGLVIFYQQYDIAPYASGIPSFLLPYEEIGATLPGCP